MSVSSWLSLIVPTAQHFAKYPQTIPTFMIILCMHIDIDIDIDIDIEIDIDIDVDVDIDIDIFYMLNYDLQISSSHTITTSFLTFLTLLDKAKLMQTSPPGERDAGNVGELVG